MNKHYHHTGTVHGDGPMPMELSDQNLERVDELISPTTFLIEELWGKTKSLPKVDEKGHSECDFAEDLYAEKEEAALKLQYKLAELRQYLDMANTIIDQHMRNLEIIRADTELLHLTGTKNKYSFAESAQEFLYNQAVSKQKTLSDLISWAESILSIAGTKKFPGRDPAKKFRPPVVSPPSRMIRDTPMIAAPDLSPPITEEIGSLLSLGPLSGSSDG